MDTMDEKSPKPIAFSEKAIANSIPIKISRKRYILSPLIDVLYLS